MLKISVHSEDEKGNVYTLLEDVVIVWNNKVLIVPVGFKSDGASVPKFFWRCVFPPGDSRALRAAFAHDFVYRTHSEGWTRKMADDMFYDLLRKDGVGWFNAQSAYWGVRIFGFSSWKGKDKIK